MELGFEMGVKFGHAGYWERSLDAKGVVKDP